MIKFGVSDSLVVPLALPGSLLCLGSIGIVYLACPAEFIGVATAIDTWASGADGAKASRGAALAGVLAVAVLLVYLISVFLGAVLAIIAGYVEGGLLDRWSFVHGIKNDEFNDHWQRYVDYMETEEPKLSIVSNFADLFLFQLRSSVALLVLLALAVWFAWDRAWPTSLLLTSLVLLVCVVLMAGSAVVHHKALAKYRERKFGDAPIVVRDALELISKQISKWCSRESHKPLAILLPAWTLERTKPNLQKLSNALDQVLALGDVLAVYESERDTVLRAKTLLDQKIAAM